ncbi:MAG TPA: helix-turn-helix domain-containing protein [Thermodesulfobacteriota bacterium]|nr:helix-turn-helix domain-containing protein [Thermodesulfobacteriota bacterium]
MRPLGELTHYEILDLPAEATAFEVRKAYKRALEIYSEDSLVIYSLFSAEERKEIQVRLNEAFGTLINERARYEYDQRLIQQGVIKEGPQYRSDGEKGASVGPEGSADPASQPEGEKPQAVENPVVKEILSQEALTGMDLKRLRMELGVSLDQISEWTKIRPGMLRCIEEDRFYELPSRLHLRSFLKAYVQYFHLNPESVVGRYMKRIEGESS